MKSFPIAVILLSLLLLSLTSEAKALESNAVISPRAKVTLISNVDAIEPGEPFHIGLRFRLTKGWHIYWLNPGDAGQPPDIHVEVPSGVTVSSIEWPTPLRLAEGPAMVFAYTGDTTLPLSITTPSSFVGNSIKIAVDSDWLVCSKPCIPEKGHFDLSIPIGTKKISPQDALIGESLLRLPKAAPFTAYLTDQASLIIKNPSLSPKTISDAWFFPNTWGAILYAAPQELVFDKDGMRLNLKAGPVFQPSSSLSGVLVLKDMGGHESYYTISTTAEGGTFQKNPENWLTLLFFALLGGLILNLMPCVFPILAMKALSLVSLSGTSRQHVRRQAAFYTFGVLATFAALDLLLLCLRTAGHAFGWGFQFQSPVFVTLMAWLLLALGLNLSGVYTIGTRLMNIGDGYASRKGVLGSFFTGVLAVVVATPCVAPFLGTAIAIALTASAGLMLAIFLTMGLGLSLPYALLTVFPGAVRLLPRPGSWMETLREALAFPMYGACAWLVWVLSRQAGASGLAYALAGAIAIAFFAWLIGRGRTPHLHGRLLRRSLLIAALLIAVFFLYQVINLPIVKATAEQNSDLHEEPYTPARLASLEAEDKPVFIDMTAAWCLTCLVNEKVAISSVSVKTLFMQNHITYLKGDWTQQDPNITAFLKQHDSEGVPLYVYYPPHHGTPVILPQILTPSIIVNAIDPSTTKGDPL